MCVPPSHLVQHLQKWVIVNVIKLWWIEQEPACLSFAAKQRPKPTATGETWQSCRLGKERVLSQLLMIMVVAGVQTDTAELVCTVRGHRSIHAHREKRDQGGGTPLLLHKDWTYDTGWYCALVSLHWLLIRCRSYKMLLITVKISSSFWSRYKAFSAILHYGLIYQKRHFFVRMCCLIMLSDENYANLPLCQISCRHAVLSLFLYMSCQVWCKCLNRQKPSL